MQVKYGEVERYFDKKHYIIRVHVFKGLYRIYQ